MFNQTGDFGVPAKWLPWKVMMTAAAIGAALMATLIGGATLLLSSVGYCN